MTDQPWLDDACSLVDAFRAGTISPSEALEASLAAIEASDLNAVSHVDADAARAVARSADASLPFGGVPVGIKELHPVAGWPYTEASLVFADRVAEEDTTLVSRAAGRGGGAGGPDHVPRVRVGEPHPLQAARGDGQPVGSRADPGRLVGRIVRRCLRRFLPIASGSDGGGSIRISAGFTGLVGLKATYGRIPRGPGVLQPPLTVVNGCLSRSVRDTARWFDGATAPTLTTCSAFPGWTGWKVALDSFDLAGKRAVAPSTSDRPSWNPAPPRAGGGSRSPHRQRRPHPGGRGGRPTPGRARVGHVQRRGSDRRVG